MQLIQLYKSGKESMRRGFVDNPGLESYLLLSKTRAVTSIADIYTNPEKEIDDTTAREYFELLKRRVNREPAAYILGYKEFYSRRFRVSPSVLIPRPETELLVDQALGIIIALNAPRVLDLGTGSGCIAVTIGCEHPKASITASDISDDALSVSRQNANDYGLDHINFVKGDLLKPFKEKYFDLIVSNPPYVSEGDFDRLDSDVRDHEPRISLVGGADGLDVIREIIHGAPESLKQGGGCVIEIGSGQSEQVVDLFKKRGFEEINTLRDLSGITRVVSAKWKKY